MCTLVVFIHFPCLFIWCSILMAFIEFPNPTKSFLESRVLGRYFKVLFT
uniref:Uncharacterized protein n=1 Tax=Tetraselmis sp. GSL018 TaxID=582737 RepID=A0A061QKN8_9CHLO